MRKSTPPTLQAELKKITVWTIRNAAVTCCRKLYVCMKLLTVFIVIILRGKSHYKVGTLGRE